MIYLLAKLHAHSSSVLLLTAVKLGGIENIPYLFKFLGHFSKSFTTNNIRILVPHDMALDLLVAVDSSSISNFSQALCCFTYCRKLTVKFIDGLQR
jgi:hypothetical protein